jgi:glycogen operon protein
VHNFAGTRIRYIAINSYWKPLEFELPCISERRSEGWLRSIDTSFSTIEEMVGNGADLRVSALNYRVEARSIVILDSYWQLNGSIERQAKLAVADSLGSGCSV